MLPGTGFLVAIAKGLPAIAGVEAAPALKHIPYFTKNQEWVVSKTVSQNLLYNLS